MEPVRIIDERFSHRYRGVVTMERRAPARDRTSGWWGGASRADQGKRTRPMATGTWQPDPSFYPSATTAMAAPPETLAYVVTLNASDDGKPDALCVVDVDPSSASYGQLVGRTDMPNAGDELHH